MNVNIDRLTVKKEIRDDGRITMDFHIWEHGADYPCSFMLHNEHDIRTAIADLRGENEFTNYFDDLSYLARFHSGGIIHLYLSPSRNGETWTGRYKQIYFEFPGSKLADLLDDLLSNGYDGELLEWDQTYCHWMRYDLAPNPKWDISPDVKHSLNHWLRSSPDKSGLKNALQSLSRIANNYSHGIDGNATVYIGFDFPSTLYWSQSYYFDIRTADNQRVMNGGIIYHLDQTDTPLPDFAGHYSMHT